jgi:hypothetical protein
MWGKALALRFCMGALQYASTFVETHRMRLFFSQIIKTGLDF